MSASFSVLIATAASIGGLHTLIGIDHTMPFVAIGRAQRWSLRRTLGLTAVCGTGHVLSSVAIGALGIALGSAVEGLVELEAIRGELAAWALIAFGLGYATWAWMRRNRPHVHVALATGASTEAGGAPYRNERRAWTPAKSQAGTLALQPARKLWLPLSGWGLFIVFVLGPCEPLIPLLIVPGLQHGWAAALLVSIVFLVTTLATMLAVVGVGLLGLRNLRLNLSTRHADVLAGVAVAASGVAVKMFGV